MRAILCDIGGVILDESVHASLLGQTMRRVLSEEDIHVAEQQMAAAIETCVLSFVPGLRRPLAWYFTKPDIGKCDRVAGQVRELLAQWVAEHPPKLVTGIREVLRLLAESSALVLAGNAPTHTRDVLAELEVLHFFVQPEVSEDIGLAKPDPRFFEYLLRKHELKPEQVVMIGDRLDNDIIPAKLFGMSTVLVKTGLYAILEPRTPQEIPDATVTSVTELPRAIDSVMVESPD